MKKHKTKKKNPLSKGQDVLLKDSLKKLLGNGLIQESDSKRSEAERVFIKDAFNAVVFNK